MSHSDGFYCQIPPDIILRLYILGERERQTSSRIKKLRAVALLFALSSKHAFEIVDSGSERIGGRRLRV